MAKALAEAYSGAADAKKAVGMSAYMRDQFPFHGIKAPERRAIDRDIRGRGPKRPEHHYLTKVSRDCWGRKEREFQYFAVDYLRKHYRRLDPGFLDIGHEFIVTKSWWDTVDILAGGCIGPYVRANDCVAEMDGWIVSDNIWVARTALLHQLGAKEDTDAERLFTYCLQRAGDTEFFIRKAIGWCLRQYARTDPHAVRIFVENNDAILSPLSKREAMKHLRHSS